MTNNFDFEKIEKRLPYTMPPNTFNEIESNVFAALEKGTRKNKSQRIKLWSYISAIAAAASIALFFFMSNSKATQDNPLTQIDMAYANLSESDQNYLIEISQEDIFLTQEE